VRRYLDEMAYLLLGLFAWTWIVLFVGLSVALIGTRGFQGPPPPHPWPGVIFQAAVCLAISLLGVPGAWVAWRGLRRAREQRRDRRRGFEVQPLR
jgi:hypothetical protein